MESALFPIKAVAIETLKNDHLIRVAGNYWPDVTLQNSYIWEQLRAAENEAEHILRIPLQPIEIFPNSTPQFDIDAWVSSNPDKRYEIEEGYDYEGVMYKSNRWAFIVTRRKPIQKVTSYDFVYPMAGNVVFSIPSSWIRVDKHAGSIQIIPSGPLLGQGNLNTFFISLIQGGRDIPQMIKIRYTAGLSDAISQYPSLVALVKRMAVLRMIDDAFIPDSTSLSADGLSESLSVTISNYEDKKDKELQTLRQKLQGIQLMVM